MTSPTASYFDFSDDEDGDDDDDGAISADEVFIDSPSSPGYAFAGAEATGEDDDEYYDDDGLRVSKHAAAVTAAAALSQVASRRTFGGASALGIAGEGGGGDVGKGTALDELRRELGYLGGMIVSK